LGDAAAWLAADPDRLRGEFVLIVGAEVPLGAEARGEAGHAHDAILAALLAELPLAQAVRLAVSITGAPKNGLYRRALALRGVVGR
jgi:16S rRNA (cytidine1402-2'-O)-methyltransferase